MTQSMDGMKQSMGKTMKQSMDKETTEASKDADDPDEPNSGIDLLAKIEGKAPLEEDRSYAYFTTLYSPPIFLRLHILLRDMEN